MDWEGHYGTTLLVGALWVLGLGLLYGLIATALMLVFTHLPDQDQYIPETVVEHRGPTHSIPFTLAVAFISASTIAYPLHVGQQIALDYNVRSATVLTPFTVWAFLAGAVTVSLVTHIATDALTKGGRYKVEPLWPVTSRSVAFGFCNYDDEQWNTGLLASGATALAAAVIHELYYSILPAIGGF